MSAYTYPGLITPEKIIDVICDTLHITLQELKGEKRLQRFVDARRITIKEIRTRTKIPYAEIGKLMNKHHATIMYMEKSYNDLMCNHAPFMSKANYVNRQLNEYYSHSN